MSTRPSDAQAEHVNGVPIALAKLGWTIGNHSGRYTNVHVDRTDPNTSATWYRLSWGKHTTRPMTESQTKRLLERMVRNFNDAMSAYGSFMAHTGTQTNETGDTSIS
jgi:hypothetical protein